MTVLPQTSALGSHLLLLSQSHALTANAIEIGDKNLKEVVLTTGVSPSKMPFSLH